VSTADEYRRFEGEVRGYSPRYEEWAHGVADDPPLLALLDELPEPKRQPNLLFAGARYTGVPVGSYADFRTAVMADWPAIREVMRTKRTQTNEPGRCAVLLPILAALPQPLALLEVGASAGLCLYPDKYSYQYGDYRLDPPTGPSAAVMECAVEGDVPLPSAVPTVAWRAGIDLNPLDTSDPEDVRWLETLIWPEHEDRRVRQAAAIEIAKADPPYLVQGDLNEKLTELAAQAPPDATLVVFHSAVLWYLPPEARQRFVNTVTGLNAHWLANEGRGVVVPAEKTTMGLMIVTHNGKPLAEANGHGRFLRWL
jgi:hypothetical protein